MIPTTIGVLKNLDLIGVLRESKKADTFDYGQLFFDRAKTTREAGDDTVATAWRLLGQLCQMMLSRSEPGKPFRPITQGLGRRSMLPADLDDVTADAIRQFAPMVEDSELRARLFDVTWCRLRDAAAGRQAIRSYLASASRRFDPEHWVAYAERIERALRLASQLGDDELTDHVLQEMERRVQEMDGRDPKLMTVRLIGLLCEFRKGDVERLSDISLRAARAAEEAKSFEKARKHYGNLLSLRRQVKDANGEREARIAIAEAYLKEGRSRDQPGDEVAREVFTRQAHEAYRAIGGMRDKVDEVYAELRDVQRSALPSLKHIETEGVDVSDAIKAARDYVSSKPLREALLALALVTQPTNFDRATKNARKLMKKYPLQHMFGGARLDSDGRVVAHITPAVADNEEAAKQALWESVVSHVTIGYQVAVQAQIVPAIQQLMFEHNPTLHDLHDLVVDNPFVPPGHEGLFAKGFLAGLRWDFAEALSILTPQLENSLRYLLEREGVETTVRDKHGLQTVINLGSMLSERRGDLEAILRPDHVSELKALFTDQHGPQLRNRVAHGLMTDDAFFGYPAIYAWWLTLHLCMAPVFQRFSGKKD